MVNGWLGIHYDFLNHLLFTHTHYIELRSFVLSLFDSESRTLYIITIFLYTHYLLGMMGKNC